MTRLVQPTRTDRVERWDACADVCNQGLGLGNHPIRGICGRENNGQRVDALNWQVVSMDQTAILLP